MNALASYGTLLITDHQWSSWAVQTMRMMIQAAGPLKLHVNCACMLLAMRARHASAVWHGNPRCLNMCLMDLQWAAMCVDMIVRIAELWTAQGGVVHMNTFQNGHDDAAFPSVRHRYLMFSNLTMHHFSMLHDFLEANLILELALGHNLGRLLDDLSQHT